MESSKKRLKVNPKPFSMDQFLSEQSEAKIGPSKRSENINLEQNHDRNAIDEAFYVIDLMAESTDNVLNQTDKLSGLIQNIEKELQFQIANKKTDNQHTLDLLAQLHDTLLEMIASQSYQDVARQKMELVINNLKKAFLQLKDHNRSLEEKVNERTLGIVEKNEILQNTLVKVEWANKKIMDSIRYAQVIQSSILPNQKLFDQLLTNSFTIWQPRDVVGGDLLILEKCQTGYLIGVLDCTGHGVPGALMTMVASSELRRIIHSDLNTDPAAILTQLNENIKIYLGLDGDQALSDVGLDAALCFIDADKSKLIFSGARIPLFYFNSEINGIDLIKGQKVSIGYKKSARNVAFKNHELHLEQTSCFWLTTDGITDQTSQENKISWGAKRFMAILEKNRSEPYQKQKKLLLEAFDFHRGQKEVLDDITVIGFNP
jgi:serine phosphatase RsbU (regulator of sigma subunit)